MVQKIDLVDHFCKQWEKLFESIERKAADDSDYISIKFLYNYGEFIGSKFIPNSFDPEKILEKLNLYGYEYCLEHFGWQMCFKFEPLFVKADKVLLLFLVYIFKKLIMAFVYHQVCKKVSCNHTFPFWIPLSVFSENGVCMLTSNQQKLYCFTCGARGTQTCVNFDNIVNINALNYIRKKRRWTYVFKSSKNFVDCWNTKTDRT